MITVYLTLVGSYSQRPFQLVTPCVDSLISASGIDYNTRMVITRSNTSQQTLELHDILQEGDKIVISENLKGNATTVQLMFIGSGTFSIEGLSIPPARTVQSIIDLSVNFPNSTGATAKSCYESLTKLEGQKVEMRVNSVVIGDTSHLITAESGVVRIAFSQILKGNK
jgi:hypothetical protein